MRTTNNSSRFALCLVAAALSACSSLTKDVQQETTGNAATAEKVFASIEAPRKAPRVTDSEDFYVSTKAVWVRDDVELMPAMFRMPVKIQVNPRASMKDVTAQLSRVTGLRFSFASEVNDELAQPTLNNGFTTEQSLKDLLDTMATQANVSWRFREGAVDIYRYDTKLFQVAALPGTAESRTSITNKSTASGQGAVSTGSSNGQEYSLSSKTDFWLSTDAEIKQMLTPGRGKASIAQATGVITVTDTPQVLKTVEAYINQINYLRSRNVTVNVQIYAIEDRAGHNLDLNFKAMIEKLEKYGLSLASPAGAAPDTAGTITAVIKNTSSSANGSQALISLLNTVGQTSVVDKFSTVTITGEPAPLNNLTNEGYLAKVSVTQPTTQGGAPTTELEPGTLTYGVSGTLTPTVVSSNDMILRVSLDLSSKLGLKKVGAKENDTSIQVPETASRSFSGVVNIKSGETLLLGFQTNQAAYDFSSMGDPSNAMSLIGGGSRASQKTRRTLVYAITPAITVAR